MHFWASYTLLEELKLPMITVFKKPMRVFSQENSERNKDSIPMFLATPPKFYAIVYVPHVGGTSTVVWNLDFDCCRNSGFIEKKPLILESEKQAAI